MRKLQSILLVVSAILCLASMALALRAGWAEDEWSITGFRRYSLISTTGSMQFVVYRNILGQWTPSYAIKFASLTCVPARFTPINEVGFSSQIRASHCTPRYSLSVMDPFFLPHYVHGSVIQHASSVRLFTVPLRGEPFAVPAPLPANEEVYTAGVSVPSWLMILITGIAPVRWLWRWRRAQQLRAGSSAPPVPVN